MNPAVIVFGFLALAFFALRLFFRFAWWLLGWVWFLAVTVPILLYRRRQARLQRHAELQP